MALSDQERPYAEKLAFIMRCMKPRADEVVVRNCILEMCEALADHGFVSQDADDFYMEVDQLAEWVPTGEVV